MLYNLQEALKSCLHKRASLYKEPFIETEGFWNHVRWQIWNIKRSSKGEDVGDEEDRQLLAQGDLS